MCPVPGAGSPPPHKAFRGFLCPGHSGATGQAQPSSSIVLCWRSALRLAWAFGPLTSEVFAHLHETAMLAEKDLEQLMT